VENNPELAVRIERELFNDRFEVLHINGESVPASTLENQYASFESAGLVVIYSCDALSPEAKRKLGKLSVDRFFDISALQLPADEQQAIRKVLSLVQSLRALTEPGHQDPLI